MNRPTWRNSIAEVLRPQGGGGGSASARLALHRLMLLRILASILGAIALVVFELFTPFFPSGSTIHRHGAASGELSMALLVVLLGGILLSIFAGFWRLRRSGAISNRELFTQLCLDLIFLSLAVLYTGGVSNPLISYLLVLLAVAATVLKRPYVNAFALICIVVYTYFLINELRSGSGGNSEVLDFQLHIVGMWIIFVVSAILITAFVSRMAEAIRSRELTLARARENEMRNEQLVAIGTLAAGTAHALGTPLSTMAVLLNELDRESEHSLRERGVKDDISLLRQQVVRCKDSLAQLTRFYNKASARSGDAGRSGEEAAQRLEPELFVSDIRDYLTNIHPGARIRFDLDNEVLSREGGSSVLAEPTLKHALINIIENAIKAARSQVQVFFRPASAPGMWLEISVQDDGPGIPLSVMERMGEPFISTRGNSMGLGIFLANAAVERCGGTIEMFNLKGGGAVTVIRLPREGRASAGFQPAPRTPDLTADDGKTENDEDEKMRAGEAENRRRE